MAVASPRARDPRNPNDGVKKQINLPWPKAIAIALNSIKIRLGRSMVTGAGIFLGIAFLCFSLTNLLLEQRPSDPARLTEFNEAHNRQVWLFSMALLVSFVGIMNSMLMSVSERFREIGTMKCLGALDALIIRLFVIEALFMGILSSLGGWLLGLIAVTLVRWGALGWRGATGGMDLAFHLKLFVISVGVGAVITLIAALLPARRAAQMPAAAALRTDV